MRLIPPFLFFVSTLFVVVFPSHAKTLDDLLTFKSIGLFEIEDQTRKKLAKKIGERLQNKIEQTFRFEIIRQHKTIQLPGQPKKILKLSQTAGVDLVLAGKARKSSGAIILTLVLLNGKTGNPFATESDRIKEWIKPDVLDQAVSALVEKLMSRIPYKALVTEVNGGTIRFNAGTFQGVEKGLKVTILEITGVERHPFTQEVIGFDKVKIGQLMVAEVTDHSSIATIIYMDKDKKIQENYKVQFVASQAALARAEILKKKQLAMQERERIVLKAKRIDQLHNPAPTAPTDKYRLAIQTGLLNDTFDFDSNELSFVRKARGIISIELQGDVWFVPSWAMGLSYRQSGMQFDEMDNNPVDVDATSRWIQGGLRHRYLFKKVKIPPAVIVTVGYQLYQHQVDQEDRALFVDYTLQGPFLGFEGIFPLSHHFGLGTVLEYFPLIDYDEGSVSSGTDSRALGYRIKAGGYYRMWKEIDVSLWYIYEKYIANFSGVGTRGNNGVTDAHSEEIYNGFNLNFTSFF